MKRVRVLAIIVASLGLVFATVGLARMGMDVVGSDPQGTAPAAHSMGSVEPAAKYSWGLICSAAFTGSAN